MRSFLDLLLAAVREPLEFLFGPEKRIFLPFLVSSALIAAVVWLLRARGKVSLVGYLFPRRIWLHRSALLDYKLLLARGLLNATLFAPLTLSTIGIAVAVAVFLRRQLGVTDPTTLSRPVIATLFTIAAFLLDELTRYGLHRALHRVPALWELHKVHHSAVVLTPFSLSRAHPLEGLMMSLRGVISLGVITGVFIWLFPGKVKGWEILGVDAIGFVFALLGANLRHSHVWISYGPALERLFISPAQHQIHHSADPRHYERNFGSALALYDWMFGSLYLARSREKLTFGLPETERNHGDGAISAIISPLAAIVRRWLRRAPRVVDVASPNS